MGDTISTVTAGIFARFYRRGTTSGQAEDQYVIPVRDRIVSFNGRSSTFVITGRAATTQNLLSIFNADPTVKVCVNRIMVDGYSTAPKAIATPPAIARVQRISANPTTGTVQTKTGLDTALTSNANVTVRGDASADRTNAATALAVTLAGIHLTQEAMSRNTYIGTLPTAAVWTELADRADFFVGSPDVILNANEGLALHLVGATTASIPATDFFIATIDWEEFTRP